MFYGKEINKYYSILHCERDNLYVLVVKNVIIWNLQSKNNRSSAVFKNLYFLYNYENHRVQNYGIIPITTNFDVFH